MTEFIKRTVSAIIALSLLYITIFYVVPGLILLAIIGSLMLM